MSVATTTFLDELAWRGLLYQTTAEETLREHLSTPGRLAYCGFDPSHHSLHVGHFVPIQNVAELNGKIQRSENQLREIREDELWDSPLIYLIFALLLTSEWILRKIFRMQ